MTWALLDYLTFLLAFSTDPVNRQSEINSDQNYEDAHICLFLSKVEHRQADVMYRMCSATHTRSITGSWAKLRTLVLLALWLCLPSTLALCCVTKGALATCFSFPQFLFVFSLQFHIHLPFLESGKSLGRGPFCSPGPLELTCSGWAPFVKAGPCFWWQLEEGSGEESQLWSQTNLSFKLGVFRPWECD